MSKVFDDAVSEKIKAGRIKLTREWFLLNRLKRLVKFLNHGCGFVASSCTCGIPPVCNTPSNNILSWFKYVEDDEKDIISALYDEGLATCGFWTPEGCGLPWQNRPVECIKYICPTMATAAEPDFLAGMQVLFTKMEALEDIIVITEIGYQQWVI